MFLVPNFPLGSAPPQSLSLRPFSVVTPDTQFLIHSADGRDHPLPFDPTSINCFRGGVVGYPHSSVILTLTSGRLSGTIALGPGEPTYVVSSRSAPSGSGLAFIYHAPTTGALSPTDLICGLDQIEQPPQEEPRPGDPAPPNPPDPADPRGTDPFVRARHLQLAVDTDFEFFQLFGNAEDAVAYIVALYAHVSDIYLRDVQTHVTLTFIRIWETPDDLFNQPDPLGSFRSHWNNNQQAIVRDAAQLISGRRDLPWGGVAYLDSLCNNTAYSVCGYMNGYFFDASYPNMHNRDIYLTAHELGHNCGTLHTHDLGVDNCLSLDTPARRGTIMSYCSQTVSGASAVTDLRFCTVTQNEMRDYMAGRACIVADCNLNAIPDAQDIFDGTSLDSNADGIPDECQDCNANSVLDPVEIAGGAPDLNANGLLDACEPDCNGNHVPDRRDIALASSTDLHLNGIPDECEADCNGNAVSDYTEIQANMPLDLDRDAVLDACQDCDGNAVPDLLQLAGGFNAWVASASDGLAREFLSVTGTVVRATPPGSVNIGHDVLITPDGRVLISAAGDSKVIEAAPDGTVVGDLVTAASGGLASPGTLAYLPATESLPERLLVASMGTDQVLEYNAVTGDFRRVLVAAASGGLNEPFGLAVRPLHVGSIDDFNLLVTSSTNEILEYNGQTGAFVQALVPAATNGGLSGPRTLLFKPDGNLLVASLETNQVLEFNGETGAFIGQWNHGGTSVALTLDEPWGLRIGPDGNVYVSRSHVHRLHVNATRVYKFDVLTGNFLESYITGNDTQHFEPTGFDFMPDLTPDPASNDCNLNLRPDTCDITSGLELDCNGNDTPDACDLASGFSQDENLDGEPDECFVCPADFNGSFTVTSADITAFLGAWFDDLASGVPPFEADFNNSGTVTSADITSFLAAWFLSIQNGC
ncbi:MAG: hypothetical protein H7Y88_03265 [Phycisphaerales bacterium]|nr:hypothetical protein [Phycisphaerales bacterium]